MESAISSAVRAPMSIPTGVRIRPRSRSPKPSSFSRSMWGPTWRALPMTPMKPAGDRNSAATESATPGASWSVWTAIVSAPGSTPSRLAWTGPAARCSGVTRSARDSTSTGSNPRSRAHRIRLRATGVAENTINMGRRTTGSR